MSANQRCHVCWKTGEPGHECPSCDKPECPFAERDRQRREMFARFAVDAAKPGPLADSAVDGLRLFRDAVLEEAAKRCDQINDDSGGGFEPFADAIRAMKEQP